MHMGVHEIKTFSYSRLLKTEYMKCTVLINLQIQKDTGGLIIKIKHSIRICPYPWCIFHTGFNNALSHFIVCL